MAYVGRKIHNIKSSTGKTIIWIIAWSFYTILSLSALLFGSVEEPSKESLTYIEGFYQERRKGDGVTIVLTDGEKYKIGMELCDDVFDRMDFYKNVKRGDALQMLVDCNTEYILPYVYELESDDKLYFAYEDAIKVTKKNNLRMTQLGWTAVTVMAILSISGIIKLIVDWLYKKNETSIESPVMNENIIRATVSGTVYKIKVTSGQQVRKGDTVLIIKSMQMQIPVLSPADAVVEQIYVSVGDVLQKDMMVVLLK